MSPTIESIRVLHVDPDPDVTRVVAEFLRQADDRIEVVVETAPEDALDRLDRERVDCVISDYEMGATDGLALLEAVREEDADLPFILYTGRGSEEIASEAISAGVTDYLQKGGAETYELLANKVVNSVQQYRYSTAARRTERRLHEIADHANDVLWMFTGDWEDLLFVNEAYEAVYGRSVDRLREDAEDFVAAIHPEDRPKVRDRMERLSAGEPVELEYRVDEREDYERWVWVQGEPIVEDGEVVRIVGFSRDVTERRAREEELELRGRAMEEAPVGLCITDPDREDNPIVYVNAQFERVTGYDASEALGRNCRFLQGERTDPETVARLREAIDAGESVSVELRNYRKDGTEWWNRLDVAPVTDDDGTVTNFMGFQQDVTDRKRREQLTQVLNRVLRHNLRNDVNTIRGFAELLAERLDEGETAEYAEAIRERADSLLALSETAGRLEDAVEGANERWAAPTDALVGAAVRRVRTEYPDATVCVEAVAPDCGSIPEPVEEALVELIENAVKHTAPGAATVRAEPEGDGRVRIEVSDEGPGLPDQDRRVLQTGRETPLEHGSGLGLWLVYRVVTDCGGTVSVPETDDGTTVVLSVPER